MPWPSDRVMKSTQRQEEQTEGPGREGMVEERGREGLGDTAVSVGRGEQGIAFVVPRGGGSSPEAEKLWTGCKKAAAPPPNGGQCPHQRKRCPGGEGGAAGERAGGLEAGGVRRRGVGSGVNSGPKPPPAPRRGRGGGRGNIQVREGDRCGGQRLKRLTNPASPPPPGSETVTR